MSLKSNILKYAMRSVVFAIALIAIFISYRLYAPYGTLLQSADRSLDIRESYFKGLLLESNQLLQSNSENDLKKVQENTISVLHDDPLNDEAIIQYALSLKKRDPDKSIYEHLKFVKSRNGRNVKAISYLLSEEVQSGDLEEAVRELTLLFKLNENGHEVYDTLLDRLWGTPNGKLAILELIKTAPSWGEAFVFRRLNNLTKSNESSVGALIEAFNGTNKQQKQMNQVFIDQLLRLKLFDKAKDLWSLFPNVMKQTQKSHEGGNFVFNPSFQNFDLRFGFDWVFQEVRNTSIDYLPNEGIFVGFDVNKRQKMISQIVPVSQNSTLIFEHDTSYISYRGGGTLEWIIRCAENGETLFKLAIPAKARRSNLGGERLSGLEETGQAKQERRFTIGGCDYVTLELYAVPGKFSRRVSANISHVKITPS